MNQLDQQFNTIKYKILQQNNLNKLTKHQQIRIQSWIKKLQTITSNNIWRKNRNNYIKLLEIMINEETIVKPFNNMPPQNNIPKLQYHQINNTIAEIQRYSKNKTQQQKQNTKKFQNHYSLKQNINRIPMINKYQKLSTNNTQRTYFNYNREDKHQQNNIDKNNHGLLEIMRSALTLIDKYHDKFKQDSQFLKIKLLAHDVFIDNAYQKSKNFQIKQSSIQVSSIIPSKLMTFQENSQFDYN